eukprot:4753154-Amphidinium_carterae.2
MLTHSNWDEIGSPCSIVTLLLVLPSMSDQPVLACPQTLYLSCSIAYHFAITTERVRTAD